VNTHLNEQVFCTGAGIQLPYDFHRSLQLISALLRGVANARFLTVTQTAGFGSRSIGGPAALFTWLSSPTPVFPVQSKFSDITELVGFFVFVF
jgi:hypothetical protein